MQKSVKLVAASAKKPIGIQTTREIVISQVELHIVPGRSRAVFTDYVSEISEGTLEPKRAAIASNSTSEDEDVQEQADSKDEIE